MLIALSYRDWKSRGFEGFPKHPEEFLDIDLDAYHEVLTFSEAVQFVRDEIKQKMKV